MGDIGQALLNAAIQLARDRGSKTLDLASRPVRETTESYYQKLGFERRDASVYRIIL
jgi:GNAT superfamily N-acetyltransferase